MPKITFVPDNITADVEPNTKLLVAATRQKLKIRYGCASCRCGTCGVAVSGGILAPMREAERQLLQRMGLNIDGSVRLACQSRVIDGSVTVDLAFQNTYSPDEGDLVEDEES